MLQLKNWAVLSVLFVLTMAQRSPYAGNFQHGYPEVLPIYLTETSLNANVAQRLGEPADEISPLSYEPYNPYEDQALLDRIATWPKENQPFWYVNRESIKAAHRKGTVYPDSPSTATTSPPMITRARTTARPRTPPPTRFPVNGRPTVPPKVILPSRPTLPPRKDWSHGHSWTKENPKWIC